MLILIVTVMINYGVDDDRHGGRMGSVTHHHHSYWSCPPLPPMSTGQQCDTNNGSEKYNSFSFIAQFNGHIDIHFAVPLETTIPLQALAFNINYQTNRTLIANTTVVDLEKTPSNNQDLEIRACLHFRSTCYDIWNWNDGAREAQKRRTGDINSESCVAEVETPAGRRVTTP